MANVLATGHFARDTASAAPRTPSRRWGGYLALGSIQLMAAGIAAGDLTDATAALPAVAAMMTVAGAAEAVHALASADRAQWPARLAGGLALALAGVLMLTDPSLASLQHTLALGVLATLAGGCRLAAAWPLRHRPGESWLVVSALASMDAGILMLALWPAAPLGLLGAIIGADLAVRGAGFIAFALVRRGQAEARARRSIPH
ncbi:DUF308 domain-containing protein [Ancylobacter amanitiformis]|uniref:Uncharacterized membrane protein HdeD (DUF308 family) n=1 Tax=Ancylobacter amanitiformis TaxID=217069 RepID=A0ABU0LT11_9HYPH|nr:DUF308 domain-containing protein [Ancylobacter amanitiformis]MDQ0511809.1 uncharacterized membrane protein HdeD (DUF308 family) [Ancylobacter amanitiformis]